MTHPDAPPRVEADDGTATLWLDRPGDGPNRLTPARLAAVARAVERAVANPNVEILVVRSAHAAGFSVGLDLNHLADLATDADRRAFAAAGQAALAVLAEAPVVTVAVIDGPCLGAGLELALACDYRLAVASPTTELGFPELADGRPPCWGGLTRITRLLGPRAAADFLDGRTVTAREAAALGLVDRAYCGRRAKIEPRSFLDRLQLDPRKRRPRLAWLDRFRGGRRPSEPLGDVIRAAAIDPAAGLAAERSVFAAALATSAVGNALSLARRAAEPAVVPAAVNPVPPFPAAIGLVGTDDLVTTLAAELAVRGTAVRVTPGDGQPADGLADRLAAAFSSFAHRGRVTPLERDQAVARVRVNDPAADRWDGFDRAGLVIVSDRGATRLAEVEAHVGRRAVVAVVGRPVGVCQGWAERPDRVIGLGPPLAGSPIIELARGPETSADATAALAAWVRATGRVPVVVTDGPRLVVRRVLAAVWDEAVRLAAEGVPIDAVDAAAAAAGLGRPLAGIDGFGLAAALPLVPRVRPLVAGGLTGGSGDGFYHRPADDPPTPNVLAQVLLWDAAELRNAECGMRNPTPVRSPHSMRLVYRAVNEAAGCLGDERHAGPADIDLAVAWGAGLLRSAGGPLRFADGVGLRAAVRALAGLASDHGPRFAPHPELARRAAAGEGFYGPAARRVRAAAWPPATMTG
jgi:enoyl-CoA hydratase/carnithine racemase